MTAQQRMEKMAVDRLDQTLAEIDRSKVELHDQDGKRLATLKDVFVTDLGRKRSDSVEKADLVSFTFFDQTEGSRKDEYESLQYLVGVNVFEQYKDLIRQIEGVAERQLPEDKKLKLLENLDRSRKAVHNAAAQEIQKKVYEQHAYPNRLKIDEKTGRKLFEVAYTVWNTPRDGRGLTYGSGELDKLDLDTVAQKVYQATGEFVHVDWLTVGFHEDAPRNQYELRFVKPVDGDTVEKAKQVIARLVEEAKGPNLR